MQSIRNSLLLAAVLLGSISSDAAEKPNVIVIMADDLGYGDLSCYGATELATPHIDRLASEGLRFTSGYCSASTCTPTRYSFLTGTYAFRSEGTGIAPPNSPAIIKPGTETLPSLLQKAGYGTAVIGKWHLGNGSRYHPSQQGYEFAAVVSGPHLPGQFRVPGQPTLKPGKDQYRTEFEADLSTSFIKQNKDQPFFLMVSPYAVHIPLGALSDKVAKYRARAKATQADLPNPIYAAMVEHCDDLVGEIIDTVEAEGLTENTMIVFTSDNGGLYRRYDYHDPAVDDTVADLAPLRGEKGNLYEAGIRVPLIIKYPPQIKSGSISTEPTISYDFYPTFVQLAGGQLPANQSIDGKDLGPIFENPAAQLDRDALYWHYPHYHHGRPASCIRSRDWKLIDYHDESGDIELYQLANDLSETTNLAAQETSRTTQLKNQLRDWRQQVLAAMPIPNPSYDPDRAHEWWSTRTGKPVPSHLRKKYPPTEKDL